MKLPEGIFTKSMGPAPFRLQVQRFRPPSYSRLEGGAIQLCVPKVHGRHESRCKQEPTRYRGFTLTSADRIREPNPVDPRSSAVRCSVPFQAVRLHTVEIMS